METLLDSIKILLPGIFIEEANTEMTLNRIPHGKFAMPWGDHKIDVELTEDFYLATTPVTQAQWINVMSGYIPEHTPPRYKESLDYFPCEKRRGLDKPVWNLSWDEAQKFIDQLNARKLAPPGYYFALPTLAQWEYACSATFITNSNIKEYAFENLHDVAQRRQMQYGLYDMLGNVNEWCRDFDYYPQGIGMSLIDPFFKSYKFCSHAARGKFYFAPDGKIIKNFRFNGFAGLRVSLQKLPDIIELAHIPAGSFMMGSPEDEAERDNDELLHEKEIQEDFYIGKFPVTQKQYLSIFPEKYMEEYQPEQPVRDISYSMAMNYCEQLNLMGYAPEGWMFTLPKESQWEYACKLESSGAKDMLNSVWQWCLNWYAPYPNDEPSDDMRARYKSLRGGSFLMKKSECRPAVRNYEEPRKSLKDAGFRIALVRTGFSSPVKKMEAVHFSATKILKKLK